MVPPKASALSCTLGRLMTVTDEAIPHMPPKTASLFPLKIVTDDAILYKPPAPNIITPTYIYYNAIMISMTTRQSSMAFKKIEELHLATKKKNDKSRKLQEEDGEGRGSGSPAQARG
jgi:hypothetical protein